MTRPKYLVTKKNVMLARSSAELAVFRDTIAAAQFRDFIADLIQPTRKDGKAPNRCPFCQRLPALRKRGGNSELVFTGKAFYQLDCGGMSEGHYVVAYGKTQRSATRNWNLFSRR